MGNFGAVITGGVAGIIVTLLMLQMDLVWKIDDPTGAIAIHGVGGAWGLLMVGVFRRDLTMGDHLKLLAGQAIGACVAIVISGAAALILFGFLKRTVGLRVREEDEFDGLDLAEHDIG